VFCLTYYYKSERVPKRKLLCLLSKHSARHESLLPRWESPRCVPWQLFPPTTTTNKPIATPSFAPPSFASPPSFDRSSLTHPHGFLTTHAVLPMDLGALSQDQ
jgi:hypothetical protein